MEIETLYDDREVTVTYPNDLKIKVTNLTTERFEFAYLTPKGAHDLADYIIANVKRPEPVKEPTLLDRDKLTIQEEARANAFLEIASELDNNSNKGV